MENFLNLRPAESFFMKVRPAHGFEFDMPALVYLPNLTTRRHGICNTTVDILLHCLEIYGTLYFFYRALCSHLSLSLSSLRKIEFFSRGFFAPDHFFPHPIAIFIGYHNKSQKNKLLTGNLRKIHYCFVNRRHLLLKTGDQVLSPICDNKICVWTICMGYFRLNKSNKRGFFLFLNDIKI